MEQSEAKEAVASQTCAANDVQATAPSGRPAAAPSSSYVYALGRVEPRFPNLSVEKEFAQATARAQTAGLTDRAALHRVLSDSQTRYLARQMCYVFTVEGVETYVLYPRIPIDYDLLVEAVRPAPRPTDVDLVIGLRGGFAPPELCNGLVVPVVWFDQLYPFDLDSLIKEIPRPTKLQQQQSRKFAETAAEMILQVMTMVDNAGATDEHRALNYCAVRCPSVYHRAYQKHEEDYSLSGVEVRPSPLSGVRKVIDVIFSFAHRTTDVTEKHFCRVDVTDKFPFLVTKMSPYHDR